MDRTIVLPYEPTTSPTSFSKGYRELRGWSLLLLAAAELLELGIVLNTINPGPVNTGYLDPDTADRDTSGLEDWMRSTPFGRVGVPTDPAALIGWLSTAEGAWIVGQVLTSDGGFSL